MKKTLTIIMLFGLMFAQAQVGINTDTPQATLDVVGEPTNAKKLDGIILPRLTGDELRAKTYTIGQTGAMVYVTAADTAPGGQTNNVRSVGQYMFDGTVWVKQIGDTTNDAWVNNPTTNVVELATKADGTTVRDAGTNVVITDAGRVGIGTTVPSRELDVIGNTRVSLDGITPTPYSNVLKLERLSSDGVTEAPYISFHHQKHGESTSRLMGIIRVGLSTLGHSAVLNHGVIELQSLYSDLDGTNMNHNNSLISLNRGGGNVRIGGGSDLSLPLSKLEVVGEIRAANSSSAINRELIMYTGGTDEPANFDQEIVISTKRSDPNVAGNIDRTSIFIGPSPAGVHARKGRVQIAGERVEVFGDLHVRGTGYATNWQTTSDRRYKETITPITSGVSYLNKLKPVSYYWNAKGKENGGDDKKHLGFIAQELEKVLPNLVSTDKKGYKSVNYTELIPVLIKAIQEQQKEFEELKAIVQDLVKTKE